MKGKYVIREYGAVMFNECYNHNDFGNKQTVKSAGFFRAVADPKQPQGIRVDCWGESVSLGIKSNEVADARKIKQLICNLETFQLDEM